MYRFAKLSENAENVQTRTDPVSKKPCNVQETSGPRGIYLYLTNPLLNHSLMNSLGTSGSTCVTIIRPDFC